MTGMENTIRFVDNWYIGFNVRNVWTRNKTTNSLKLVRKVMLGFLVPDELPNMKNKVNKWAHSDVKHHVIPDKILRGFTLGTMITRNGHTVWRVQDPRGFILEISAENLSYIIQHTSIIDKEIQCACRWAWSRNVLYLLPVDSDLYKDAQINTDRRHAKRIRPSDVTPGSDVVLVNGERCSYLGTAWITTTSKPKKKYHVMRYGNYVQFRVSAPTIVRVTQDHNYKWEYREMLMDTLIHNLPTFITEISETR